MALHKKLDALMALEPDVAVVCECAEPERLRQRSGTRALPGNPVWIGSNPNKGLAIFAFNGYRASLQDIYDPRFTLIAPVRIEGRNPFNLLAVWALNFKAGTRRKAYPGPVRAAIAKYTDFLSHERTFVAGDFNNNVIWDKPGNLMNFETTLSDLDSKGLVSAYHARSGEAPGEESTPTHYWRDRKKDRNTYHIDYVFVPRHLLPRTRGPWVGSYEDWCGSDLSDHVPLTIDVAF